jgi:hypothetical protein
MTVWTTFPSDRPAVTDLRWEAGYYVYEITVDGIVRYVGCGKNGKNGRVFDHLRETRYAPAVMIRAVIASGAKVQYRIVCDGMAKKDALREERKLVASHSSLWTPNPAYRGQASKRRWFKPGAGAHHSQKMRDKWNEPEFRETHTARLKRVWHRRERGIKLTKDKVMEIRGLIGTETQAAIAKRFGVSQSSVCDIAKGRTWLREL